MTFPSGVVFVDKIYGFSLSGYDITTIYPDGEYHGISSSKTGALLLVPKHPNDGATFDVYNDPSQTLSGKFTLTASTTPAVGQVYVDFVEGTYKFNPLETNTDAYFYYTGFGTKVTADGYYNKIADIVSGIQLHLVPHSGFIRLVEHDKCILNISGILGSIDTMAQNSISVDGPPLTYDSGIIGITRASTNSGGYLTAADWNTFNNKTSGTGTVNYVGISAPDIFTVSNSPIVSSGIITITLASQTANKIFASPDGLAGAPTFRFLVDADLPTTLVGHAITQGSLDACEIGGNEPAYATLTGLALRSTELGSDQRTIKFYDLSDAFCINVKTNTVAANRTIYIPDANGYFAVAATSPLSLSSAGMLTIPAASESSNGYLTSANWTTFNSKESAVASGLSSQYYRGDKTWRDLNTGVVPESGNLYFTEQRVRDTIYAAPPIVWDSNGGYISFEPEYFNDNFAAKTTTDLAEGSGLYFTTTRARNSLSVSGGALTYNNGVIGLTKASATTSGYISAADYIAFSAGGGGAGTVTYVALSAPNIFSTSGAVTSSGQLSLSLVSQTAGKYFAAPSDADGLPSFRAIAQEDLPQLITVESLAATIDMTLMDGADLKFHDAGDNYVLTLGTVGPTSNKSILLPDASGTVAVSASSPIALSSVGNLSIPAASSSTNGYLSSANWSTFNSKESPLASGTTLQYYRGDKTWQTLDTDAVAEGTNQYFTPQRVRDTIFAAPPIVWDSAGGYISLEPTYFDDNFAAKTTADLAEDHNLYYTDSRARAAISVSGLPLTYAVDGIIGITRATSSTNGYLSSADWTTFNSKVSVSRTISTAAPLTGGGDLSSDRILSMPAASASASGYLTATDWSVFNGKVGSSDDIDGGTWT